MYMSAQGQARSEEGYGRRGERGGRGASFNDGGERYARTRGSTGRLESAGGRGGRGTGETRSLFLGKLPLR